jgi:hypothetical protein
MKNKTDDLTIEQSAAIITKANKIKFENIIPPLVMTILAIEG